MNSCRGQISGIENFHSMKFSLRHRYVFFMSPRYPKAQRLRQFERDSIQVWSVAL
jgi:hypothetical protein